VGLVLRHPVYVGIAVLAVLVSARRASQEGRRSLGAVGAIEVGDSDREHARLVRLVAGLSQDLGIERPEIWIFGGSPRNCFVIPAGSRGALAVSAGYSSELALTELESVVAHCLLRLRDGVPSPRWARWVFGWVTRTPRCSPAGYDVGAAALTRYPPGLARAIGKAEPREGRDRGLWFVPAAEGDCSPAARIATLEEL
jgi:hypothetical protein